VANSGGDVSVAVLLPCGIINIHDQSLVFFSDGLVTKGEVSLKIGPHAEKSHPHSGEEPFPSRFPHCLERDVLYAD
jgi:hypothetical protein